MPLAWILVFSVLGSVGAIGGAALLLIFPDDVRKRLVPALVAYAAGTLLGAAFLGMIPAAAGSAPIRAVSAAVLAGIILFFLLERLVLWRHAHEVGGSSRPAAPLILIGDALHNFVDGVVIAAAFLSSVPLGVAAGLAVVAHEVPQEVGDPARSARRILVAGRRKGARALRARSLGGELHLHRGRRPAAGTAPLAGRRLGPACTNPGGHRHDRHVPFSSVK